MSDIFDHESDAWDQALQMGLDGQPLDEGYYDGMYIQTYGRGKRPPGPHTTRTPYVPGMRYVAQGRPGNGRTARFDTQQQHEDYFAEEAKQPEFQQLVVSQLHGQTEKSYCVSGTVHFDVPYRGMHTFEFLADWVPKKCCTFTGDTIRLPQWLIRSRWQQRKKRHGMFDGLMGNMAVDFKTRR